MVLGGGATTVSQNLASKHGSETSKMESRENFST